MPSYVILNTIEGVFVYGHNGYGQLGLGDIINRNVPTKLNFDYEVLSICCGSDHTIFNTTDGIFTYGRNYY